MKIENVEVVAQSGQYLLACVRPEGRYHCWIDRPYHGGEPDVLYKRSHVERGKPGYFETRKLKATSQFASEVISLMRITANAKKLFGHAEQVEAERLRKEEEENKKAAAIRRQKEAGPELFAALQAALPFITLDTIRKQAEDALHNGRIDE